MRAIDADELLTRFSSTSGVVYPPQRIKTIIKTMPTISPKTGVWQFDGRHLFTCSECHHVVAFRCNYCPECGAKMS